MMSRTSASSPDCSVAGSAGPLHALLDERASAQPDAVPFRFLPDGENPGEDRSQRELAQRARAVASSLLDRGLAGKPVLLMEAPGPDFIEGLFGCWHAGAIAVPAYPPRGTRHRQRLEAVMADSGASFALGSPTDRTPDGLEVVETSLLAKNSPWSGEARMPVGPCLLQYTSGSTSSPKGVMITHANLRAHHAALQGHKTSAFSSMLSWLPPYHDMGLVLKLLNAFEDGVPLIWFSADHFIQRPVRWLRAISRYRAEFSGAPDFAFDACTRMIRDEDLEGIDLSCWKAAPCGAERVRASTLRAFARRFGRYGFSDDAFHPGYGMAETTLIVTALHQDEKLPILSHPQCGELVSSGTPLEGVRIRITDPVSGMAVNDGVIGEIRAEAPLVAQGYWGRTEETQEVFVPSGIRTGDLGFLKDGHLYVTGRRKDLIIVDGVNHSPEDIEETARLACSDVRAAAAFSIESGNGERVNLLLEGPWSRESDLAAIRRKIRTAVASRCGVAVASLGFTKPGLLPRTTSGKIRRFACREAMLDGSLKLIEQAGEDLTSNESCPTTEIILEAVREVSGHSQVRSTDDLGSLGMRSIDAARLAAIIEERSGARVPIGCILAAGSFAELAQNVRKSGRSAPRFAESGGERGQLTHSQQRMWFLHQLDPQSAAYHVFGVIELDGILDHGILARAFDHVVAQHPMLFSRHGQRDGNVRAWIDYAFLPELVFTIIADESAARRDLEEFATIPFDLENSPPFRAKLVTLDDRRHLLAVCAHHIAADGWSMRVLATQLGATYSAMVAGSSIRLPGGNLDFLDYAARHRDWADGPGLDGQLRYWKERLNGHPGSIPLPIDAPRNARGDDRGGLEAIELPAAICNQIEAIARARGATPFMVQLAAFLVLLRQHGAGDDLITAVPVANRHVPGSGHLVGTLVNTLPFRIELNGEEDFHALLDRVKQASFEMLENQDAPFERILAELRVNREENEAPLAQVMFDHQEIPIRESWAGGLSCQPYTCHRGASQFDLSMLLNHFPDRQQLCIEYRRALFEKPSIEAMLRRHLVILNRICEGPESTVSEISALDANDLAFLESKAEGPIRPDFPKRTAPWMIAASIAEKPGKTAVLDADDGLTYQELGSFSSRIAAALRSRGVTQGAQVVLLVERDRRLPAAMLGIWKCGAVCVPLDPSNPPARLAHILADQKPACALASSSLAPLLAGVERCVLLDEVPDDIEACLDHVSSPQDTAYIIHTSGSTGRPKGVIVSHGALGNFLQSMAETPGFTEADHLLAVTTVSFDIAMLELLLPLSTGGSLTVVPGSTAGDGLQLLEALGKSGATVMQATPATWRMLVAAGWKGSPDLKILCGGEAMDPGLARTLWPLGCQLWNLYGPTETTVWSTCWRVPRDARAIRIGAPIANTGVHILGKDGRHLPPGVAGDLWISGSGLADGYWNHPELTAGRFTCIRALDGREIRAYQTGDLARWIRDGSLECLGRSDGQIKIRGFRVELGEIDSNLGDHPAVSVARSALRGESPETRRIVAWIVPRADGTVPEPADLKHFLAMRLPSHMIPADIGVIECFPLGASGKIDVSRLPDPVNQPVAVEPETETERRLIALWCELLERPLVSPLDNWFHVGGHSLLALRLFSRIHQVFGVRAPLSAILENPNPRSLAALIDRSGPTT